MQAWTYTRRGPLNEILEFQHDFPKPSASDLKPDEVLVKISHVTLTAAFANLMTVIPHFSSAPKIPEHRFAGSIAAIFSATSTPLAVGDEVFGMVNPKQRGYNGVLAEYAVMPIDAIVRKPENVDSAQASGLGGYTTTPIEFAERAGLIKIIETAGHLRIMNKAAGKRILVTGGNTSLGHFMVQLLRWLVGKEGEIIATSSERSEKLVIELGAHKIIDHTSVPSLNKYLLQEHSAEEKRFDTIIDIAGTDSRLYPRCPAYLKEDGFFIFGGSLSATHAKPESGNLGALIWIANLISLVFFWVIHMFRPVVLGGIPRKAAFLSGTPSQRNMRLACQLVEDGILRSIVDSEWKIEDLIQAYDHLTKDPISGKVVVKVQA